MRVSVSYQPFSRTEKVVVCGLALVSFGRVVPLDAELRSPADIGQCEQASTLHEASDEDTELRSHGDAVATIRGHDRGVVASFKYVPTADEIHGDPGAIVGLVRDLRVGIISRVERAG